MQHAPDVGGTDVWAFSAAVARRQLGGSTAVGTSPRWPAAAVAPCAAVAALKRGTAATANGGGSQLQAGVGGHQSSVSRSVRLYLGCLLLRQAAARQAGAGHAGAGHAGLGWTAVRTALSRRRRSRLLSLQPASSDITCQSEMLRTSLIESATDQIPEATLQGRSL